MTDLISPPLATFARTKLAQFLVHSCTITPRIAGAADGENNVTYSDGTPVTGVACKYVARDRVVIQATGQTLLSVPTVTVAYDQTVALGSIISNIQASGGVVLLAGPAVVEEIEASAGFGPVLKKTLVLRGADVR